MTDERRQWAEDHGYQHYTCRVCGWSGWTDGDPRGECYCGPPDEDEAAEGECVEPEE